LWIYGWERITALDLIPPLLGECPWMKIVVITACASIDTAVEAMRRGATDYLPKPFTPEQVELVTNRVAKLRSMELRIVSLKEDLERLHPEVAFTSRNHDTQRAIALARQVASSEAVVLLRSPSGTGKTVLAQAIHRWSHRANKPFGVISLSDVEPGIAGKRIVRSCQRSIHRCASGESGPGCRLRWRHVVSR
jgi:NtrC-family two-component system response regulator AlgB